MKDHCSKIVAIGEAAVVGAGVGVALIGAMEIATSIAAQQWLLDAKYYLDCAPLLGSVVGAMAGGLRIARRRWATARIAGLSHYPVPIVRPEFEGNLPITKLDKMIAGDGKVKPAPNAAPM